MTGGKYHNVARIHKKKKLQARRFSYNIHHNPNEITHLITQLIIISSEVRMHYSTTCHYTNYISENLAIHRNRPACIFALHSLASAVLQVPLSIAMDLFLALNSQVSCCPAWRNDFIQRLVLLVANCIESLVSPSPHMARRGRKVAPPICRPMTRRTLQVW